LFLDRLSKCSAYATTAGFESICEAMYLGKPVMMVPAHIEQYCNMIDAERAGAGIGSVVFDFNRLVEFKKNYQPQLNFRYWIAAAERKIMEQME